MITIKQGDKVAEIKSEGLYSRYWKVEAKQYNGNDWVTVANMSYDSYIDADNWATEFVSN